MTIKVTLEKIKNTNPPVFHPFWFTTDRTIHLNTNSPMQEVDLTALSFNLLVQLNNACIKGIVGVNDTKALQEALAAKDPEKENGGSPSEEYVVFPIEPKEEVVSEDASEEAEDNHSEKESELTKILLSNSIKKLNVIIGSGTLNQKNELLPGMTSIEDLELMKDLESQRGDESRKTVAKLCNDRIKAINECNGFIAEEDEILDDITIKDVIK